MGSKPATRPKVLIDSSKVPTLSNQEMGEDNNEDDEEEDEDEDENEALMVEDINDLMSTNEDDTKQKY